MCYAQLLRPKAVTKTEQRRAYLNDLAENHKQTPLVSSAFHTPDIGKNLRTLPVPRLSAPQVI